MFDVSWNLEEDKNSWGHGSSRGDKTKNNKKKKQRREDREGATVAKEAVRIPVTNRSATKPPVKSPAQMWEGLLGFDDIDIPTTVIKEGDYNSKKETKRKKRKPVDQEKTTPLGDHEMIMNTSCLECHFV